MSSFNSSLAPSRSIDEEEWDNLYPIDSLWYVVSFRKKTCGGKGWFWSATAITENGKLQPQYENIEGPKVYRSENKAREDFLLVAKQFKLNTYETVTHNRCVTANGQPQGK